jgi:hypothetical protein
MEKQSLKPARRRSCSEQACKRERERERKRKRERKKGREGVELAGSSASKCGAV